MYLQVCSCSSLFCLVPAWASTVSKTWPRFLSPCEDTAYHSSQGLCCKADCSQTLLVRPETKHPSLRVGSSITGLPNNRLDLHFKKKKKKKKYLSQNENGWGFSRFCLQLYFFVLSPLIVGINILSPFCKRHSRALCGQVFLPQTKYSNSAEYYRSLAVILNLWEGEEKSNNSSQLIYSIWIRLQSEGGPKIRYITGFFSVKQPSIGTGIIATNELCLFVNM